MSNPNATSALGVSYTATWTGEGRVYRRLCPLTPHTEMGHLLAWPADLLKIEVRGEILKYEGGVFMTDDWRTGECSYSPVLLSATELGQVLIHAQRARYLVTLHEEGR